MSITSDTPRRYEANLRNHNELPVKGSTNIPEGAAVGDDASGYARNLVAADPFMGVALRRANNSAGSDGSIKVDLVSRGGVEVDVTGVTGPGDVGDTVYASDNGTFTKTAGSNTAIGRVKRHVSGTKCVVAFEALYERSL